MASFTRLFGETLLSKDPNNQSVINRNMGDTADLLRGKDYVLLLFSAEYCRSCRDFLYKMNAFYKEFSTAEKMNFEVVFVSSDQTAEDFKDYYRLSHSNWLALPYDNVRRRMRLFKRYSVSSIPTVVILDGTTGKLVCRDARNKIEEDQGATGFPWKPRDVIDILKEVPILDNEDRVVRVVGDGSEGVDNFALYFAAHWCHRCRAFTPLLDTVYRNIIDKNPTTHFIYVSFDASAQEYKDYNTQMQWCRLPFQHDACRELVEYLNISRLPSLVTINSKNGKVLNYDGVDAIDEDEEGSQYPWAQVSLKAVTPLVCSLEVIEAIKSLPCIVLTINNAPNRDVLIAEFTHAGNEVIRRLSEKDSSSTLFDEGSLGYNDNDDDPGLIDTCTSMNPIQFFVADDQMATSCQSLLTTVAAMVHEQLPPSGTASVFSFHLMSNIKHGLLRSITASDIIMYTDAFVATLKKSNEV